jgi:hypothetical protein
MHPMNPTMDSPSALRMLRPGGATVKALVDMLGDDGDGDSVNGPLPCMLVHKCIFVLERHKEDTPTMPQMKYRLYVPGVPVTLLNMAATAMAMATSPPDDDKGGGEGGSRIMVRRMVMDTFFRESECGASGHLQVGLVV